MQWGRPQPRSGEGDVAMLRSGARSQPATMQWGRPQPRSGEGDVAMRRSGANEHRDVSDTGNFQR
jgi:hypothetical protein